MLNLYFGDLITTLTTALILGTLAIIGISVGRSKNTDKWGRLTLAVILVGTAISALSATRDQFMLDGALFTFSNIQAMTCAIAGGIIILTGLITLFVRNQKFRKVGFFLISALFIVQVAAVEASRIGMVLGGAI